MKKFVLLFFFVFFFSLVFSMSGDGSVSNPFVITTCVDLQNIKDNLSGNYILGNDVECYFVTRSGGALWNYGAGFTPIGAEATPFRGSFNGKNFSINGVFISNGALGNFGVFGYIKNASIKNTAFTNLMFLGGGPVGGVAGISNASTISDVYVTGQLRGSNYLGGIVGEQLSGAQIIKAYSFATIIGSGYGVRVGGLVGNNASSATIKNSFSASTANIMNNIGGRITTTYGGGIAGANTGSIISSYWVDPSGKITNCYYLGDSGCTKAASLETFYSSNYAVYNVPPAWSSSVWEWSSSGLPTLKEIYFCYGFVYPNSEIFSGDDIGLSATDERTIILSQTNTSRKCEYRCKEGFYLSNGQCVAYVCKNDNNVNELNSTICENDGILLPSDLNKILVNFGSCTQSRKCELQCGVNYFVSNDKKSCEPYYCNSIPSNATVCPNDNLNLTQNIDPVLVDSLSACTLERKCEYYCGEGTYQKNNSCAIWACGDEVDKNNMALYEFDNTNLLNKDELTSVLVEKNTARKCEWYCLSGFYISGNSCKPFVCNGVIDTNSIMCNGDNFGLDKNYSISVIDSAEKCSNLKCEWYCRNGYYSKDNKCFPLSTLTCEGGNIENAVMCTDDDVFLTQKGITNILVTSKENCSESRKCQWYCKEGYYQGNGIDSNKCIPYSCYGAKFENALMYYQDDLGVDKNTPNNLVDVNTSAKCEYYCKQSYHIETQNGVKKCVPNIYSCIGSFDNATMFDLEESELDYNVLSVLSNTNTSRKCEWKCNVGYASNGKECISTIKEEVNCGGANRDYFVDEEFPGESDLCDGGVSSTSGLILNNLPGSIVSWKCIGDNNVSCKAMRILSSDGNNNFGSILELSTEVLDDGNILVLIKCANDTKVNLSVTGYLSNEEYDLSENQIDCNKTMTSHIISLVDPLVDETDLIVKTSIKNTSSNCLTCEMSSSVSLTSTSGPKELDPIFIVILVGIVLVLGVLFNIFFNSSGEDELNRFW